MLSKRFRRWLLIGIGEIVISLILLAIAPVSLNSNKPAYGFTILIAVPSLLLGSVGYASCKLKSALEAKKVFVTAFPQYKDIPLEKFLEMTPDRVAKKLEFVKSLQQNDDLQQLNISLFEVLEQIDDENI